MSASTNGASASSGNATVVRAGRGLTVGGSRLTINSLVDHFKAGHSDELVRDKSARRTRCRRF
jgi:hypothetical protein